MTVLLGLGALSLVIWLGLLLHPARPWDFQPVGDDGAPHPEPHAWPPVCVLVPARNERESLPHTLPALLQQDYPGGGAIVVIDDRSYDGTAEVARRLARECAQEQRLIVLSGAELPPGWVGKVWALEQGAAYCGLPSLSTPCVSSPTPHPAPCTPQYLLLTDADIHHAPGSLRRLVTESENARLALNSRMARLRCVSGPERFLVPPFVFFFNLLYPMRRVNDAHSGVAAAAGGCVLLSTAALERIGGFACIRDRVIDDVSLARAVKAQGLPIRLSLSHTEVSSLREYRSLTAIWGMVRRTAFTELRHSWLRLAGAVIGLALMFLVPPVWTLGGGVAAVAALVRGGADAWSWIFVSAAGALAWGIMAAVYRPAVRFFGVARGWVWALPFAGVLYGAMTVDSALRHVTGLRTGWRDR